MGHSPSQALVRFQRSPPSFVRVLARESHAGQHSSKVLVSRRFWVRIPALNGASSKGGQTGLVSQVTYRVPLEFITRVNGSYNDGGTTLTNSICHGSPLGRATDCLSDLGGFDSRPWRQF